MLGSFIFVMFPRVISFSVLFCMLECSFFEKFRWSAGTDSRFAIGISSLIYFQNCISPYIVFALFTVASCKVPVIIVYACICFALNLRFFLIVFYFILFYFFDFFLHLHCILCLLFACLLTRLFNGTLPTRIFLSSSLMFIMDLNVFEFSVPFSVYCNFVVVAVAIAVYLYSFSSFLLFIAWSRLRRNALTLWNAFVQPHVCFCVSSLFSLDWCF